MEKVTYISSYPPMLCGIGFWTRELVSHMESLLGTNSSVIAVSPDISLLFPQEVRRIIKKDRLLDYIKTGKDLSRVKPSLIHVQHDFNIYGGRLGNYIIPLLALMGDVQKVITMHTVFSKRFFDNTGSRLSKLKWWLVRGFIKALVRLSDRVVAPSKSAADVLAKDYGIKRSKLSFIPLAVDLDFLRRRREEAKRELGLANRKVILTYGFYRQEKGFAELVRLMPRVVREVPHAMLLIIGATLASDASSMEYRENVMRLIRGLNLSNHVLVIDQIIYGNPLMKTYMACSDVCVFPHQIREQYSSLALNEAMGYGLPIISTNFTQAEELLLNGCGLLSEIGDHEALANTIAKVLTSKDLREELGGRSYEFARNRLSWEIIVKQYSDLYNDLMH